MTQTNLILRNNLNEHVLSFPIPYFFHSNNFSRSSTRHIYSFLVILKHFSLGLFSQNPNTRTTLYTPCTKKKLKNLLDPWEKNSSSILILTLLCRIASSVKIKNKTGNIRTKHRNTIRCVTHSNVSLRELKRKKKS